MKRHGRADSVGTVSDAAGRPAADGPVVLLEGASDVAAVRAAALVLGVDDGQVRYVDLRGITNVRAHLDRLTADEPDTVVLGMCDAKEAHFVVRALTANGGWARDADDLPASGFFVCHSDLEDELIRALGPDRAVAVLRQEGLLDKLAVLQQQPAWRGRPLEEALHRFAGVASGRKELFAGALAATLTPETVPEPLRLLVERLA